MLSSRDRVKAIASKEFFNDIDGKQFEEDQGEEEHVSPVPEIDSDFKKLKGSLDDKEEEEGFDDVTEIVDENGSDSDSAGDINLMISNSENSGDDDNPAALVGRHEYIETDLKHFALSDELESHLSSQEEIAAHESGHRNSSLNISLPKLVLDEIKDQKELDETCMGLLHAFAAHLGWSVVPMYSQVSEEKLIINVKQVKRSKQHMSISSTDMDQPVVENLAKVNRGRSSERFEGKDKERFKEFVEKMSSGQIRFIKKKKNGFISLTLATPGVTMELVKQALDQCVLEKDVIDMILRESNMLTLVKTLCIYP
ncbi:phosphoprotein [Le Dantec virus]|uniref:Phosphoprotein n=1 Tax=Le Dantec virus TaxID=318848 RepID=A0A0D3R1W0_9RHAB|nr:phosphoprotein [Le Dantec virus]AJR28455.1 phosphoprotein [Le Dantec virus]